MDVVCPFYIEHQIGFHFVASILFDKTDAIIFSFSLGLHLIHIVTQIYFEIWSPNMWQPLFFQLSLLQWLNFFIYQIVLGNKN
jgi:hypothetical protein